ncbi:uncharacterized protein LOC142341095 [Convolutriloba macropyga]|uniref:uncharacterized protein LOC142341095 n=1 Tax=Convolutriloba macropyga TaxID=536237 RepID=UPI003F51F2FD
MFISTDWAAKREREEARRRIVTRIVILVPLVFAGISTIFTFTAFIWALAASKGDKIVHIGTEKKVGRPQDTNTIDPYVCPDVYVTNGEYKDVCEKLNMNNCLPNETSTTPDPNVTATSPSSINNP